MRAKFGHHIGIVTVFMCVLLAVLQVPVVLLPQGGGAIDSDI